MVKALWAVDGLNALDAKKVVNTVYGGAGVVILDPDGNVAWKGLDPAKGPFIVPSAGKASLPFHELQKNIKPLLDKGLLGGLTVPTNAKPIAKLIKLGNLAGAQVLLKRLSGSGPSGEFKEALTTRFEELRKRKLALFEEMQKAEKLWEAYKAGDSYVRCFPKAKDVSKVKSAVYALKSKKAVKDNISAKSTYTKVAALAYGSKGRASVRSQAVPLLEKLVQKYEGAEFAEYSKSLMR
jgi:hypothetical protein